jgi:hypothetical protein
MKCISPTKKAIISTSFMAMSQKIAAKTKKCAKNRKKSA